jgi:UDP-glucuronate 4-epimerase
VLTDYIEGIKPKSLHYQRYQSIQKNKTIYPCDIRNYKEVEKLIQTHQPNLIIHLAAKTGITESELNPKLYFDTNVTGFYNVLENARVLGIKNVIYASSSSVYSQNNKGIFTENSDTNSQASYYGTTKKLNELLAQSYSTLYKMNCIGLRFFTVYGSWAREDMAAFKFMTSLLENKQITLYNNGEVTRDFTHVNDIVEAILKLSEKTLSEHNYGNNEIFNIGNNDPKTVLQYLNAIEFNLNTKASINFKTLPNIELQHTHASSTKLEAYIKFKPKTNLQLGVKEMCEWFLNYYQTQHTL